MSPLKLPAAALADARAALAAPLAHTDVKFKATRVPGDDGHSEIAAYASVHAVRDRLDLVLGAGAYSVELRAIDPKDPNTVIASISVGDVKRESVGISFSSDIDAPMWAEANAVTRAARCFGIGRSTQRAYAMPAIVGEGTTDVRRAQSGRLWLPDELETKLRNGYEAALKAPDGRFLPIYGPPLPHRRDVNYDAGDSRYAQEPLASNLAEAEEQFRRPFAPEALLWSAGRQIGNTVVPLAIATRMTVEDYLDAIVGPQNWSFELCPEGRGVLVGSLTIFGVVRESRGTGSSLYVQEARAFKRAAQGFGLGRYLTADGLVQTRPVIDRDAKAISTGDGTRYELTDEIIEQLREEYTNTINSSAFGERHGTPIADFEPVVEGRRRLFAALDEGDSGETEAVPVAAAAFGPHMIVPGTVAADAVDPLEAARAAQQPASTEPPAPGPVSEPSPAPSATSAAPGDESAATRAPEPEPEPEPEPAPAPAPEPEPVAAPEPDPRALRPEEERIHRPDVAGAAKKREGDLPTAPLAAAMLEYGFRAPTLRLLEVLRGEEFDAERSDYSGLDSIVLTTYEAVLRVAAEIGLDAPSLNRRLRGAIADGVEYNAFLVGLREETMSRRAQTAQSAQAAQPAETAAADPKAAPQVDPPTPEPEPEPEPEPAPEPAPPAPAADTSAVDDATPTPPAVERDTGAEEDELADAGAIDLIFSLANEYGYNDATPIIVRTVVAFDPDQQVSTAEMTRRQARDCAQILGNAHRADISAEGLNAQVQRMVDRIAKAVADGGERNDVGPSIVQAFVAGIEKHAIERENEKRRAEQVPNA